jgi:hypothetical protein
MNAQELKERTKQFALRVMHLVDALPKAAASYISASRFKDDALTQRKSAIRNHKSAIQ